MRVQDRDAGIAGGPGDRRSDAMIRKSLVLVLAIAAAGYGAAQARSDFSLSALPTVSVPLGPTLEDGLPFYSLGGGGSLRAELKPGFARLLFGRASLDADFLPIKNAADSLTLVSLGLEAGLSLSPGPRIAIEAGAGGGMYLGMTSAGSAYNPFAQAGAELQFRLSPSMAVGLGGGYKYLFTDKGPLYHGLSFRLGVAYDLAGARKGTEIRIEPTLDSVFPLFFSYYDKNPLGKVLVANGEGIPIEKVKVSFFAKQYMDSPKTCAEFASIPAGATVSVPLTALFNDSIFRVTEGTKTSADLLVEYYYLGKERRATRTVTLQVNNRNAMTWEDDRKAAAFVTAKDPLILGFAKGIAATVRNAQGANVLSSELRTALGIFQGLTVYGMGYVVDPKTPYASLSASEATIDFLQFPNQTLAYRGGDCDDLTTLYCALLESVGIASAFITVPGHIYAAFDSGLAPESAAKFLADPEEAIARNGKLWIPVEITLVKDGFIKAWAKGAQEWREASATGSAAFYEVRAAWALYEPVGFAESAVAITLPAQDRIAAAYRAELDRLAKAQVGARAVELQAQIKLGVNPEQARNKLGVLYAQYGLYDEARRELSLAAAKPGYAPPLVNLGNVEYLSGNPAKAVGYYEKAAGFLPGNAAVLSALARAFQANGDAGGYSGTVARLAAVDAAAAARLSGDGGLGRAAEAGELKVEADAWSE
jgi:tetratricopeptide (TPR) repeat protein